MMESVFSSFDDMDEMAEDDMSFSQLGFSAHNRKRQDVHTERNAETVSLTSDAVSFEFEQLLLLLLNQNRYMVSPIVFHIFEPREAEERIQQMKAIDAVFGMLNDLSEEQFEEYEKATRRGQFF